MVANRRKALAKPALSHGQQPWTSAQEVHRQMMPYALPPAEAKLSMKSLARSLLPARLDFSSKLAGYLGVEDCILANSARALLYLVFRSLKTKKAGQHQILLPGYTCYSLPAAAVKAGFKVSLYDLDPYTFEPDLDDVQNKISSHTLAVVVQNLLGTGPDMQLLSRICQGQGACLVLDSAQSLVAWQQKNPEKAEADYTVYSFGRGKPLPLGQGGALVAARVDSLQQIAREAEWAAVPRGQCLMPLALHVLATPWLYWCMEKLPLGLGRTIFDPGFKVGAMSLAPQRLGWSALDDLELLNAHRNDISGIYSKQLASESGLVADNGSLPRIRYPILVQKPESWERLAAYGVRRLYPKALCDLKALQPDLAQGSSCNLGAREIAQKLLTLPTHVGVSRKTALRILQKTKKALGKITEVKSRQLNAE